VKKKKKKLSVLIIREKQAPEVPQLRRLKEDKKLSTAS
jgi:hypothetical protein